MNSPTDRTDAAVPLAPGPERGYRWVRQLALLAEPVLSAPVTLVLVAALWIIGAATGSLRAHPPHHVLDDIGVGISTLEAGHWWTPVTSLFWCSGIAAYVASTLLLLLIGPQAERRLGTPQTAWVLVGGQVAGTLLGTGLVRLGVAAGSAWTEDIKDQIAVGPTPGIFALAMVLSFRLTTLWKRRLQLLALLVPLVMVLYVGYLSGVQRLAGAVVGLLVGAALHGRPGDLRPHRSSHNETRVLVALCVAASAVGPLVASLYKNATGPFNVLGDLYFSQAPTGEDIRAACETSAQECARAHSTQQFFNSPGLLMGILIPVLLFVLAEGLRRGLRLAWWITVAAQVGWMSLVGWGVKDAFSGTDRADPTSYVLQIFGEALLLPVLILMLLLLTQDRFGLRLPRRAVILLAVVIGGAFLLACAAYVGIGWLLRDQYEPPASLARLLKGLPAEFLPPAYNDLLPAYPVPSGGAGRALEDYCGLLFWVVALTALLVVFRRPWVHVDAAAAARARALLERHGGSTLSFISTWDGNHYWFDERGEAGVAYRVFATVALTTGDPFGEPAACERAVAGFAAYCDARGWTPCFYSVTAQTRGRAVALGWRSLQVAEDTVVALPELAFTGKKWQDIRTSLNKAKKEGITAQWWTWGKAPLVIQDQVRSISEEWVSDKGLPEMGFTLGGLEELDDPAVRMLVAVDEDRTVHGLTSWMPVYREGEPVGWTLDFMRRSDGAFRGVMEFLIASAALGFKEEGALFLSLSGAPLARADQGEVGTALQRMLDWMGRTLEPVYGFRSLLAFKSKFQPEYRPMYMVYPDPAALASITRAIGKAYLPHLTPSQGMRLMRKLSS
ncbi:phosphatidylglycerol lysyltransferase [Kitasatospora sp. MAP12-15]|uniref:rhomboid family intramembrane serine protease n=1 Tax=unclassified Kitasatospora TaxID=2633591 RepID=UPI002473D9B5|nr:rhomboid family intramembrane serine protease [Kitasatospora sp. MAP12-44]MDH6114505.1 phosphatidylglycerol lysyltransferase [Kitasatospora sp. MAP12-44]